LIFLTAQLIAGGTPANHTKLRAFNGSDTALQRKSPQQLAVSVRKAERKKAGSQSYAFSKIDENGNELHPMTADSQHIATIDQAYLARCSNAIRAAKQTQRICNQSVHVLFDTAQVIERSRQHSHRQQE
jgi:hypothetical protein